MLLQTIRGDTAVFSFTLPFDLVLADVTFRAKRALHGPVFLELTADIGGSGSGDSGECSFTVEPADTEELTHTERFIWEVQVDDGSEVHTAVMGRWVVAMDLAGGGSGS